MASLKGNAEAKRRRNLIAKKLLEGRDKEFRPRMEPNQKPRDKKLTVHNLDEFMKEIDEG